jgi:hypothetical protein
MGAIYNAACGSCDFQVQFTLGGNRTNFRENSPVPAIKKATVEFVNPNYIEVEDSKDYRFYWEEKMSDAKEEFPIQYFGKEIQRSGNLCPQCNSFSLGFKEFLRFG